VTHDIIDIIDRHADTYRNKRAVIDSTGSWTYGELSEHVRQISAQLHDVGLGQGARVALLMPPGRRYVAALLAVLRARAAVIPVNTRLTRYELASFVDACRPTAVLAAEQFADLASGLDLTRYVVRRRRESWSLQRLLGRPQGYRPSVAFPPDEAIIIGTGGTTGRPKGAVLSRSAVWHWTICAAFAQRLRVDDVELFGSPFFHSTLLTGLLTPLVAGATVCIPERFDVPHVVAAVQEHGITRFGGAPTMLARAVDPGRLDTVAMDALRSVRTVQFGATKAPPGFVTLVRSTLPHAELITGYGATEFGPVTRCYTEDLGMDLDGSVGRPVPAASVTIVDPETGSLTRQPGIEGQIAVHCPWQMSYYSGDRALTAEVVHSTGAILSGDVGRFDPSGSLVLAGRLTEMIITGGENVFPSEVERALVNLPGVRDLAVYGVPDPEWGERVEVAVAMRPGAPAPTLGAVRDAGRVRLADYKLPRSVVIVEELPFTTNAKVDRRRLAASSAAAAAPR
jgi:acyl-CoA synthetase (AMP-forming)/AMP-acid ligase II